MRWWACLSLMNFTPKSTTTNMNCMRRDLCVNRPGVCLTSKYPAGDNIYLNHFFARIPDCSRTHIPRSICIYIVVDKVVLEVVLLNIFCRMRCQGIFMY